MSVNYLKQSLTNKNVKEMNNKIAVAKIIKPQGIKGELKVLPLVDDAEALKYIKNVEIDGIEQKILNIRIAGGEAYIVLRGVADRNVAESFREKEIFAEKDEIEKSDDSFFIVDIIGCDVFFENGEKLGTVTEVTPGTADVFTVKDITGKNCMFPFLEKTVSEIDVKNKRIVLIKDKLLEVLVYDD